MTTPNSDQDLLAAARSGDDSAIAELWSRHVDAAVRVARQFDHSGEAEDIVAEAFAQILAAIRAGGGPVVAFRPYLFRTVSNVAQRTATRRRKLQLTANDETLDTAVPFTDPLLEGAERSAAVRAYRSLGRQHQAVVWYVDVEGLTNTETARLLGTTPGAIGSMVYRARETLRTEFLQAHIDARRARPECRQTLGRLSAYVRGTLTPRPRRQVEAHLDQCDECRVALAGLGDVGASLRAVLLPLVLAPAAYEAVGPDPGAESAGASHAGAWAVVVAVAVTVLAIGAVAVGVVVWAPGGADEPGTSDPGGVGRDAAPRENEPARPEDGVDVTLHPAPSPPPDDEAVADPPSAFGDTPPITVPPGAATDSAPPAEPSGPEVAPEPPGAPSASIPDQSEAPEPPDDVEEPDVPPVTPEEPEDEDEPDEPEPPEEPEEPEEFETEWRVVTDEAWASPGLTHFVVTISGAEPGEPVEAGIASPSAAAVLSPITGHLPAEPPLVDDGEWDCADSTWSATQECSAVADDDGGVAAVFAVASGAPEVTVEMEVTAEDRERHTVTLSGEAECPAPDSCEAPEPPEPPDDP